MDMITKYGNYQLALRERKELEALKKIFPLPFDHFYMIEVDGGDFEKPVTVGVIATSDTEKKYTLSGLKYLLNSDQMAFSIRQ